MSFAVGDFGDHSAHLLALGAGSHQDGVAGIHHRQIVHAHDRQQPPLVGVQKAAVGIQSHHVADGHVAVLVAGAGLPEGVEGPQVAPADIEVYHRQQRGFLGHSAVERRFRHLLPLLLWQVRENAVRLGVGVGLVRCSQYLGGQVSQLVQQDFGLHHEQPAVPQVPARLLENGGCFGIRLLVKVAHFAPASTCRSATSM